MLPSDGDIVIVRQQEDAETGDIVTATVNGTSTTCKRLRKYKDGILLIANNPLYDPMDFSTWHERKQVSSQGKFKDDSIEFTKEYVLNGISRISRGVLKKLDR